MENKPKCTIDKYRTKRWVMNGQHHRLDGPAIEYLNGEKHWYVYGSLHRLDGPAIEYPNKSDQWYFRGLRVTDIITLWAKENNIDLDNLSEVDKFMIKLEWANYGRK